MRDGRFPSQPGVLSAGADSLSFCPCAVGHASSYNIREHGAWQEKSRASPLCFLILSPALDQRVKVNIETASAFSARSSWVSQRRSIELADPIASHSGGRTGIRRICRKKLLTGLVGAGLAPSGFVRQSIVCFGRPRIGRAAVAVVLDSHRLRDVSKTEAGLLLIRELALIRQLATEAGCVRGYLLGRKSFVRRVECLKAYLQGRSR